MKKFSHITTICLIGAALVIIGSSDLHAATFTATAASNGESYTIVEADPFRTGGTAGNTLATSSVAPTDGTHFWSAPNGEDGLWWDRTSFGADPVTNYVALGGTQIHVLNLNGSAFDPEDDDHAVQVVTTVTGLPAAQYEVFSVYAGFSALGNPPVIPPTWSVTSDLGTVATTVRVVETGDPILLFGEVFQKDIVLDTLGTTAGGVTSFQVATRPGVHSVGGTRSYWIGVAYQAVPEPSGIILATIGLLGLCGLGRRKRRNMAA